MSRNPDPVADSVLPTQPKVDDARPDYPWKRSKKVACMLSFSGKDYYGMQRNPGDEIKTIEDELLAALNKSGQIDPTWETAPQKAFFVRASRTDKGVSAARMVVSLKMLQEADTIKKVNSFLPSDIRLQHIVRVTKNFNCQSQADARTYLYLTPTFSFSPVTDVVTEGWRCGPDTITNVNNVFKSFLGVHYYHNYTSGKLPMEPSSQRYIMEFEAGQPFEKMGMEWSVVKVKGQSFMLHQIRKMVGLGVAVARGHTSMETVKNAWGMERIDIPRAPGLGLMLDQIHYDRYNKKFAGDGVHEGLGWEGQFEAVEKFKEDFIFSDIIDTEVKEKSMLTWMGQVLPMHTFTPRHFESEVKESSPIRSAILKVSYDTERERKSIDVEEEGIKKARISGDEEDIIVQTQNGQKEVENVPA
eukprot:GFUD01034944.1.p1 GENE.GFUD01034944.1~~GFUD01034944.1.p1  ORF type:complete len:415 (-),score=107.52 GFUD01034944.1:44-1288(-)